jgi:hypothetical protein
VFGSAVDARKRPESYTPVCVQADDKAGVVVPSTYSIEIKSVGEYIGPVESVT